MEKYAGLRLNDKLIQSIKDTYNELKSCYKVAEKLEVSVSSVKKYADIPKRERKQTGAQAVVAWRKKAKLLLIEYKGGKCSECGYDKCIRALQFHHLDPNEKDFGIGGKSVSLEKLKKEVDKCILVCGNCHAEIHEGLRSIKSVVSSNLTARAL